MSMLPGVSVGEGAYISRLLKLGEGGCRQRKKKEGCILIKEGILPEGRL
ncbi:hypothetical protein QVO10_08710 [Bacteroides gallinaceum]|uniref:Uncharacterized protein n=2 Tax=Bacteroidaceae TaxID=815 RepID=A0ABT7X5V6_9BACE|nr:MULTISPECIES: hypothetical protein [Bacteroidaceae]MBD8040537.1 hypothetical protein [Phocaeicola intestinalis]MBM6721342.1 hypothetical protein [Bacteroides gallinaceum]MBM6945916.1 hypothetical protein [Bacteroides gallinaceum]MDN0049465.1 hypothetical protein [Bacteroides gallinaceum]